MLLFPFLFGSQYGLFFSEPYFGAWSYTELAGYAGVFGWVLAAVALVARRDRLSIFWALVALAAVMLALGDALHWLAKLIYQLPVLNQFRAPSRHIYEYGLAISVLAGLGVAALQRGQIGAEMLKKMTTAVALFFTLLSMVAVFVYSKATHRVDSQSLLDLLPGALSPAIYMPIVWMVLSVLVLHLYAKGILGAKKEWLVLLIVTLEMSSFGWFQAWRHSGVGGPPAYWRLISEYKNLADQSRQKLVSIKGRTLPVDRARLFGVHSLNWYGQMLLKRYSETTGVDASGRLDPNALLDGNVGLDIFGGRYLFTDPSATMQLHGIPWYRDSLDLIMGNGCRLKFSNQRLVSLRAPVAADRLAMVTHLGCSPHFADGEPVGEVILHGLDGQKETVVLRAGIDTAEWAADCQGVISKMRHRKADIFDSTQVLLSGVPACDAHSYLARPSFTPTRVASIEIKVRDNVRLNVLHLTLSDSQTGSTHLINPAERFLASKRWRFLQAAGGVSVYENTRAMPRAWLAFEAIPVAPEQALAAIRTSVLPDGRNFDPVRQVLTEKVIPIHGANPEGTARVIRHEDTNWEISAQSNSPSLLVIGQNYYPGWQATVDGSPVDLLRVNYSQQGLPLPAGDNQVTLEFRPVSFMRGLVISSISLVGLFYLFWRTRQRPGPLCEESSQQPSKQEAQGAGTPQVIAGIAAPSDPLGPRYQATLSEGITFNRDGYPGFVSSIKGISGKAHFGRWTDGTQAVIEFTQALPKNFTLKIKAGAFPPTMGKPIKRIVGATQLQTKFIPGLTEVAIPVATDGNARSIIFEFPDAKSPKELGLSADPRRLSLALVSLQIE